MDATAYYAIGIPLYIALFGVESAIARRHGRGPELASSVSNICVGLGAIVVGMVVGPVLVALYTWAYRAFALLEWPGWWPAYVAAVVLGDLANYWRHRSEHRFAMLWAVHNVHHTPTTLDLSVGMRHAWLSDTYAFPFYAALPLLGIPAAQFFLAMVTLTVYALFTHSREYRYPSFGVLITPHLHALHHASNPRYAGRNFGAMFSIWDRLFGTYAAEVPGDPPVFGLARPVATHDGAYAQWRPLRELARSLRSMRGLGGKLRALAGPPVDAPATAARPTPRPTLARYAVIQLVLLIAFAGHVFSLPSSEWAAAVAGGILIVAGIVGIGGLLDGRRGARAFETIRLALFAPAAIAIVATTWSTTWRA